MDGSTRGFTEENTNSFTRGGWQASFADQRVMFCNGQFDPWRSATVSSDYRPSGPLASTAETPIFIVEGGVHVPDLIINPNSPDQVSVVEQEIAVVDACASGIQCLMKRNVTILRDMIFFLGLSVTIDACIGRRFGKECSCINGMFLWSSYTMCIV